MNVISRQAWGAVPPTSIATIGPVGTVYAHTQASVIDQSMTPEQEAAIMRRIQRFHMAHDDPATPEHEGRDFSDIAYSFLIFPSGRVYEEAGAGLTAGTRARSTSGRSPSASLATATSRTRRPSRSRRSASSEPLARSSERSSSTTESWDTQTILVSRSPVQGSLSIRGSMNFDCPLRGRRTPWRY